MGENAEDEAGAKSAGRIVVKESEEWERMVKMEDEQNGREHRTKEVREEEKET